MVLTVLPLALTTLWAPTATAATAPYEGVLFMGLVVDWEGTPPPRDEQGIRPAPNLTVWRSNREEGRYEAIAIQYRGNHSWLDMNAGTLQYYALRRLREAEPTPDGAWTNFTVITSNLFTVAFFMTPEPGRSPYATRQVEWTEGSIGGSRVVIGHDHDEQTLVIHCAAYEGCRTAMGQVRSAAIQEADRYRQVFEMQGGVKRALDENRTHLTNQTKIAPEPAQEWMANLSDLSARMAERDYVQRNVRGIEFALSNLPSQVDDAFEEHMAINDARLDPNATLTRSMIRSTEEKVLRAADAYQASFHIENAEEQLDQMEHILWATVGGTVLSFLLGIVQTRISYKAWKKPVAPPDPTTAPQAPPPEPPPVRVPVQEAPAPAPASKPTKRRRR